MKSDFIPYEIGKVFNNFSGERGYVNAPVNEVIVKYPSRLNAMALDPSKIVSNENMIFSPGEIFFSLEIYIVVKVSLLEISGAIDVSSETERPSLVRHAVKIMRQALGVNDGLSISVQRHNEMKHCGFGSSSRLISATAVAINEMYGNAISKKDLVRYLAQNHGEEIDGNSELINPVQCIGGSASSGIHEGGLQIITGQSSLIKSMNISDDYVVIIGVPQDFVSEDSKTLLEKEIKSFPRFLETGRRYAKEISYRVLHEVLPAMEEGDLKPIGNLIFDYRFNMGSIENCSFVYPRMTEIAKNIAFLKEESYVDVLSVSSVGPAFFAILNKNNLEMCKKIFKKEGLDIILSRIENNSYTKIL